jgi:Cu(I)/Ag(I) efflux system membrane fusion protein
LRKETNVGINKRVYTSMLCLIVLGGVAVLAGCGGSTSPKKAPQKPAGTATAGQASDKDHTESAEHADVAKGLAKLSDADRLLAEKQKVCPVSDEPLGEHGKPTKITIEGETVFLCCPACETMIKKDPKKYLVKLKAKGAK